jgi:hypothetical protein
VERLGQLTGHPGETVGLSLRRITFHFLPFTLHFLLSTSHF